MDSFVFTLYERQQAIQHYKNKSVAYRYLCIQSSVFSVKYLYMTVDFDLSVWRDVSQSQASFSRFSLQNISMKVEGT